MDTSSTFSKIFFGFLSLVILIIFLMLTLYALGIAGHGDSISKPKVAVITAEKPNATHIVVTYQGGQDVYHLRRINVTLIDSSGKQQSQMMEMPNQTTPLPIGSSIMFTGVYSDKSHIVGIAFFSDNSETTIFDAFI